MNAPPSEPLATVGEPVTILDGGDPRSWRITRMILAVVAIVALAELIIFMTVALALGVSIADRIAHPAPVVTGCPFGPDACGG